ncbi:hypothetical protein [Microcella alkalica]|uniref:hypothetical protein n=1 Tax=Microcella alkalica TaxID=355930 RepID=UPI001CB70EA0|nr:hypothetical protein [Microcella alkalica]
MRAAREEHDGGERRRLGVVGLVALSRDGERERAAPQVVGRVAGPQRVALTDRVDGRDALQDARQTGSPLGAIGHAEGAHGIRQTALGARQSRRRRSRIDAEMPGDARGVEPAHEPQGEHEPAPGTDRRVARDVEEREPVVDGVRVSAVGVALARAQLQLGQGALAHGAAAYEVDVEPAPHGRAPGHEVVDLALVRDGAREGLGRELLAQVDRARVR